MIQKQIYWREDKKMASSKTKSTEHARVLYSDKDTQTQTGRPADHLRLRRPDWKNIGICWQTASSASTKPKVLHKRHDRLHKLYRKQTVSTTNPARNNGCNKPLREQEEGTQVVCKAYNKYYQNNQPVPTEFLREMLRLILKENSLKFTNKSYLQLSGCAMGTKIHFSPHWIWLCVQPGTLVTDEQHLIELHYKPADHSANLGLILLYCL